MLMESGGDPEAYSSSGAVGLMQVMPRDGLAADFECANGPCFASRPTIEELLQPEFNLEYGTHMLASLITRLGSEREALKAYGPMDVEYSYADRVLAIFERYQ
jgi:soluble lytic murein transglycosylase-like protein